MRGADNTGDDDALLESGETWVFSCTFSVPAHTAGEEDPILNTASVTGDDLDDDAVTPDSSNQVSVEITHDAGVLTITKSADVSSVAHGGTVTYTFNVTYVPGQTVRRPRTSSSPTPSATARPCGVPTTPGTATLSWSPARPGSSAARSRSPPPHGR